MNRPCNPIADAGMSIPLRAMLATALLALSAGNARAVPDWHDSYTEPTVFEQGYIASDDHAPAPLAAMDDNEMSEALFLVGPDADDTTIVLAGLDPLQTP